MPQGPIKVINTAPGGINAAYNITAAAVIKASPGTLFRIMPIVAGTAGNLTVNDVTTVAGAAAANEILTIAFGSIVVGQEIVFEWPCSAGITISAVTTGGQFAVSYS